MAERKIAMKMPTTRRRNQKYLILDTESVWDPYLREAYDSIDKKNDHARIGCRKLIAVSLWAIEFDALGRLSTEPLQTWLATDGLTESDILAQAFQTMRRYSDHVLVGHGSIAHDCQIMMLAAMSADLELPRQLQPAAGPRWRDLRHIDIGLAMKAGGKTWHHLSELLLRLGLPVGLMIGKADPGIREKDIRWSTLQEHCERDVLFTSLALTALLRLEGQVPATIPGMHLALCEAFLRQRPRAVCAPLLRRFADEMGAALIPASLAA
jgi:hypothetical protein|tara:strand:- start:11739 stop:12539 length:801 start_codon:yes stop_codon:yes gene_type:complete